MKKLLIIPLVILASCQKYKPDNRRIPNGTTVYLKWTSWNSFKKIGADVHAPYMVDSLSKESFSTFYDMNFYFCHDVNDPTKGQVFADDELQFTPSHESFFNKIIH